MKSVDMKNINKFCVYLVLHTVKITRRTTGAKGNKCLQGKIQNNRKRVSWAISGYLVLSWGISSILGISEYLLIYWSISG